MFLLHKLFCGHQPAWFSVRGCVRAGGACWRWLLCRWGPVLCWGQCWLCWDEVRCRDEVRCWSHKVPGDVPWAAAALYRTQRALCARLPPIPQQAAGNFSLFFSSFQTENYSFDSNYVNSRAHLIKRYVGWLESPLVCPAKARLFNVLSHCAICYLLFLYAKCFKSYHLVLKTVFTAY